MKESIDLEQWVWLHLIEPTDGFPVWGKSLPALRCMLQYICIRIYHTDARLLTTNNENTLGNHIYS